MILVLVLGSAAPSLAAHRRHRRSGWVSIEARPPEQRIRLYINGRRAGVTPVRRLRLRAGKHTLEAIRPDGVRQRRVLRIRAGQERHLILAS
jgi:hypothetical protein